MHDADAAVLRQADRRLVLGDGVHRRREQRDVQRDLAREARAHVDLLGEHFARTGHEQHVVEGQTVAQIEAVFTGIAARIGVGHAEEYGRLARGSTGSRALRSTRHAAV